MALGGLQSVRDALMLARMQQYISDTEFILLYECNLSKPLFPYRKFELFDLDSWDDEECKMKLRFAKSDLPLIKGLLGIPRKDYMSARNYMFWNRRAMYFPETTRLPMQISRHGDPIW